LLFSFEVYREIDRSIRKIWRICSRILSWTVNVSQELSSHQKNWQVYRSSWHFRI